MSKSAYPLLDAIRSPRDIDDLSPEDLRRLAAEIRVRITAVVAERGGHLASSLGVVELTIALHRAFDFARDRLVFDVGHQCYPHKLLTGRHARFDTLRTRGGISGFPNPAESPYDVFATGHASTAISQALGLACAARGICGGARSVALVGDGSIGGGLAFEALNSAGHLGADLLVVLNDNEMSISRTVGAMAKYLGRLRADPLYNDLRREARSLVERMPVIGAVGRKLVDVVRSAFASGGVFDALGFRYFGPVDGHDLAELEGTLSAVRHLPGPVLIHVLTRKGEGLAAAAADPSAYHSPSAAAVAAAARNDGSYPESPDGPTYTDRAACTLAELARADDRVVAITAAMPEGTGLDRCATTRPEQFYDVGICEAHAVTFAGGLARAGMKPVVGIYSTFLQRAVDSIFHDVCLQGGLGVVILADRAGFVGADGPTHHGLFDVAMLRSIPNLVLAAPRDGDELEAFVRWAVGAGRATVIRYPRAAAPASLAPASPIELGKAEKLLRGERVAILAYGASVAEALGAARELEPAGIRPTVVNVRFAKPLDGPLVRELAASHEFLVTVEEAALVGGVGAAVCEELARLEGRGARVVMLGVADEFVPQATRREQMAAAGIDAASIARTVVGLMRDQGGGA